MGDELMVVPGSTVRKILDGNEELVLRAVTDAYLAHERGHTRSPRNEPLFAGGGRFFAMPSSIDDGQPMVGMKWVASFAGNVAAGEERASALLVVNDAATGRPVAIVDGTLISAKRTAASAAVALRHIAPERHDSLALVGCGPINYEVFRFVHHVLPMPRVLLVDTSPSRAGAFSRRLQDEIRGVTPIVSTLDDALQTADVVSIATNATVPHIAALPARPFVILHISLRDIAANAIAAAYNIVDDVEHVCSARTSLHLAAEATSRTDFIRGTIPALLAGTFQYARPCVPTVVSPFGMSILDLAVLREVLSRIDGDAGVTRVRGFRGAVWQ